MNKHHKIILNQPTINPPCPGIRNISRKSPLIGLWRLGAPSVSACTEAAAGGRELGSRGPSRGRVHLVTWPQRPPLVSRGRHVRPGQPQCQMVSTLETGHMFIITSSSQVEYFQSPLVVRFS